MLPWADKDHKLTGNTRLRLAYEKDGWWSRHVVFVVQVYPVLHEDRGIAMVRWRDLRATDLEFNPSRGLIPRLKA